MLHPPFSRRYFPSQLARFLAKGVSFTGERLGIPAPLSVIIYNFCGFLQAYTNFESVKLIEHSPWLCSTATLPQHGCDSTSKGLLERRCHSLCVMLGELGCLSWGQLGPRLPPNPFFGRGQAPAQALPPTLLPSLDLGSGNERTNL